MISTATPPTGTAENQSSDRYLDVPGSQLRFRDEGRGAAVILLHGWTLDLEMWDLQVAALRHEFRLVRFDRRGFGLSSGRPDAQHDSADITALCRHLGINRAALIGMSQGARVALQFAASAPHRVYALILDGPPAVDRTTAEDDVPLSHLREVMLTRGIEALRREWSEHPLVQPRIHDPKVRQMLDRMLARYSGQDLGEDKGAPPLPLHSVRVPTLILSGTYDLRSRLQTAERLRAQLPCADYRVVPDAGHLINLDQPRIYNELCRAFLARHAINPTN
jgi:pimeloyl-ACP methyl ester carboxylesterase